MSKITIDQVKKLHPSVFKSIFEAGIKSERYRTSSWFKNSGNDLAEMRKGIESGTHPEAINEELTALNLRVEKKLKQQQHNEN